MYAVIDAVLAPVYHKPEVSFFEDEAEAILFCVNRRNIYKAHAQKLVTLVKCEPMEIDHLLDNSQAV